MNIRLVYRLPELIKAINLSKTTIYELMQQGEFPKPVMLTTRTVGWPAHEVRDWLENRPRRVDPAARGKDSG